MSRSNSVTRGLIAAGIAAVVGAACAPPPVVPVKDLSRPSESVQVIRIVRSGDTLYSVSWAAGVDYRELAAWNGIAPPYVIRPGQRLSLVPTGRKPPAASRAAPVTDGNGTRVTALEREDAGPASKIEPAGTPIRPAAGSAAPAPTTSSNAVTPSANKPAASTGAARGSAWQWPVRGKVVGGYGQTKGLDIAVRSGTPVKAASDGRVVYAGSGLRGYGQLVIVKHSEEYLSAYGHNRKLLVQEGDSIVSGQVIAESGSAPGGGEQVHFEIRRNGQPVDPAALLPRG